jgi:hypothetical protein
MTFKIIEMRENGRNSGMGENGRTRHGDMAEMGKNDKRYQ